MEHRKWVNNLLKLWCITSIILGVGVLLEIILPAVLKNYGYLEMILDTKESIIPLVISGIVFLVLAFAYLDDSVKTQKYTNKVAKRKPVRLIISVLSSIFCMLFIFVESFTIASSVTSAKNVETLEGKVDKVYSISEKPSGKVDKVALISDSNGKKHKFVPSKEIESLDINKNDEISLDYIPSKYAPAKIGEITDGIIMGYKAHS